jgi:hypothetical protein
VKIGGVTKKSSGNPHGHDPLAPNLQEEFRKKAGKNGYFTISARL